MKNKGFTLIELLAVIIIIGLIAVITIPKINDSIESSKKNLAQTAALNYKKTIEEQKLKEQLNKNIIKLNGDYSINSNGNIENNNQELELEISGEKPKNGYLTYIDDELESGCITINKYAVTLVKDEVTKVEKGDCIEIVQTQAENDVSNYISSLLADSTIQAYPADRSKKVSEISTPTAPAGVDENSWIYFEKGASSVTAPDYSIKITKGKYTFVINSVDGVISTQVQSTTIEPQKTAISIQVIKAGSALATGDTVKLKWRNNEEEFIVILNDPNAPVNTTMLLANNNIDPSIGYQGTNGQNYPVAFSESNYWMDTTTTPNTLKSAYTNNGEYTYNSTEDAFVDANSNQGYPYNQVYPYIYDSTKDDATGDNYSVAYYVKMYVQNLQNLGFTGVNSGRILKYTELQSGGIAESYTSSGEHYWLGSAWNTAIVREQTNVGRIASGYRTANDCGVRPVIYISTSDIQ